jgi:putative two-component system response regulator
MVGAYNGLSFSAGRRKLDNRQREGSVEKDIIRTLVIEDNPDDVRLIKEMFRECGIDTIDLQFSGSLQEGIQLLGASTFDVVLIDLGLPDSQGLETLQTIRSKYPQIPAVVLTGYADEPTGVEAVRRGAQDYLIKGHADGHALHSSLRYAIEREKLENRLQDTAARLRRIVNGTVDALVKMAEIRDMYNVGQQHRVAGLASAIAAELNLPDEQIECVRTAALLHDIGKVAIPPEILNRPERRGPLETSIEQTHVQVSCDVLSGIEFPWPVSEAVMQHHEMFDGSGFPRGLKGDGIMIEARILAVADEVDEMAVARPWRPVTPGLERALEYISEKRGKSYDPRVVDACLKVFREGKYKYG